MFGWEMSDIPRQGAAQMYRKNFDRCREHWKLLYRQKKELRSSRSSMT